MSDRIRLALGPAIAIDRYRKARRYESSAAGVCAIPQQHSFPIPSRRTGWHSYSSPTVFSLLFAPVGQADSDSGEGSRGNRLSSPSYYIPDPCAHVLTLPCDRQANIRIMETVASRLGIPMDKVSGIKLPYWMCLVSSMASRVVFNLCENATMSLVARTYQYMMYVKVHKDLPSSSGKVCTTSFFRSPGLGGGSELC